MGKGEKQIIEEGKDIWKGREEGYKVGKRMEGKRYWEREKGKS